VLRWGSICRELQRYFQNQEANWGPQLEMMESGKPCRQKMFITKRLVSSLASTVVEQGMRCLILVN
jgi:hypothetical protein